MNQTHTLAVTTVTETFSIYAAIFFIAEAQAAHVHNSLKRGAAQRLKEKYKAVCTSELRET